MERKSISCNIVIYPPENIVRKVIVVSHGLKKNGGLFTLGKNNYYPHTTLYMTEFPRKNLEEVKTELKKIAARITPFHLHPKRYGQDSTGYVDVEFKINKDLAGLHQNIVKTLNPLREGLIRANDQNQFHNLTQLQQQNLLRYGYRSALSLFRPHLTFTKLKKAKPGISSKIPKRNLSFRVTKIGLFQSGKYGSCKKLLAYFPFG